MADDPRSLLADLRESTLARLAQLEAEIAELRADRGADVSDDEHDPDGTTLSGEWSLLTGLRERELRELADVESATARLDDGDYGRCVDCGRSIPIARLRVRPTAQRCVSCAQKAGL